MLDVDRDPYVLSERVRRLVLTGGAGQEQIMNLFRPYWEEFFIRYAQQLTLTWEGYALVPYGAAYFSEWVMKNYPEIHDSVLSKLRRLESDHTV